MKSIWKYLIPAALGVIIGLLSYPHIFGKEEAPVIIQPPETTPLKPQPFKPDTVEVIRYINVPAKPSKPDVAPEITVVTSIDDEIEESPGIPYYESEIQLFYDATMIPVPNLGPDEPWLAKTITWSYSVAPSDSFRQEATIRWGLYYDNYVEPIVLERIRNEKFSSRWNGAIAGITMAGGIAYGEWWSVVGGMGLGYLVLFNVIELPF
jgi:hypothetical protein